MVDRTNLLLFVEPSAPGQQQRLLSLQEAYDLMVSQEPGARKGCKGCRAAGSKCEGWRGWLGCTASPSRTGTLLQSSILSCQVLHGPGCCLREWTSSKSPLCALCNGPCLVRRDESSGGVCNLQVGCGFSTDKYLVYAKLMRAGYIVQRWGKPCPPSLPPSCCFPTAAHLCSSMVPPQPLLARAWLLVRPMPVMIQLCAQAISLALHACMRLASQHLECVLRQAGPAVHVVRLQAPSAVDAEDL